MARKGMTGQLNMFDFFSSIEEGVSGEVEMVSLMPGFDEEPEPVKEEPVLEEIPVVEEPTPGVEVPVVEELTPVVEVPVVEELTPVVEVPVVEEPIPVVEDKSQKTKKKTAPPTLDANEKPVMSRTYEIEGENIEIAYLNYNKVRMVKGKHAPEIQSFESSKEAVDYYVKLMQSYEPEDV